MPAAIRKGIDLSTGHNKYKPVPALEGSHNVFTNKIPNVRVGDKYMIHCRGKCHVGVAAKGSKNVFINGRPAHRQGDALSCKDIANNGSHNVFIGG